MINLTKEPVKDDSAAKADELIKETYLSEYKNMFYYAYNIFDDKTLAESAVQETFLVALQKPEQFTQSEKPVGWLYTTLKYVIKHMRREKQYLLLHTVSLGDSEVQALTKNDKYNIKDVEQEATPDMELLTEHYLNGFSIKEIASKYDLTVGACKMRMKRAREALAKKLKNF